MKVQTLGTGAAAAGPGKRLQARFIPEDRDAEPQVLLFETRTDDAPGMGEGAEPLAVVAFSLALLGGEARVLVEGPLCPRLRDGLHTFGARLALWHPELRVPILEATEGFHPGEPNPGAGTGLFLSGGVDAFALLEENLRSFPREHPGRFTTAIHIHGLGSFDHGPGTAEPHSDRLEAADRYAERLASFCSAHGVRLIYVRSNARALFPNFDSWSRAGYALGLVAPGLAFDRVIREIWVASDGGGVGSPLPYRQPFWLHFASTSTMRVSVGQAAVKRIDKVARLGRWTDIHGLLRVCPQYDQVLPAGDLNCGRCEKCLRTMLEFLACGAAPALRAFSKSEVRPSDLSKLELHPGVIPFFRDLVDRLEAMQLRDLARALHRRLARFERAPEAPLVRRLLRRFLFR